MSPMQGKPPSMQVKEPYDNLDMVTCRTGGVQSKPTNNARKVRVRQYIKKERTHSRECISLLMFFLVGCPLGAPVSYTEPHF